jgi:hypothetical protein
VKDLILHFQQHHFLLQMRAKIIKAERIPHLVIMTIQSLAFPVVLFIRSWNRRNFTNLSFSSSTSVKQAITSATFSSCFHSPHSTNIMRLYPLSSISHPGANTGHFFFRSAVSMWIISSVEHQSVSTTTSTSPNSTLRQVFSKKSGDRMLPVALAAR